MTTSAAPEAQPGKKDHFSHGLEKLSLVITHRGESVEHWASCLASAAAQTLRRHEYEILLVNDGSTDPALALYSEQFVNSVDNATVLNLGASVGGNRARYEGFLAAQGGYLLFLDGGDVLERYALERMREAAFTQRADLVSCRHELWNRESGRLQILGGLQGEATGFLDRLKSLYRGNPGPCIQGSLIARRLLSEDIFPSAPTNRRENDRASLRLNYLATSAAHVSDALYFHAWSPDPRTAMKRESQAIDDFFHGLGDRLELACESGLIGHLVDDLQQGLLHGAHGHAEKVLTCASLDDREKLGLMEQLYRHFSAFPLTAALPEEAPLCRLGKLLRNTEPADGGAMLGEIEKAFDLNGEPAAAQPSFPIGLEPSLLALGLKGRIVFVCDVDYQLRNASAIARRLADSGCNCTVVDNSLVVDDGKRRLPESEDSLFEGVERIQFVDHAYPRDAFSTARLLVLFNDWHVMVAEPIAFRNLLGLPTVALVEGISDFLRVDATRYGALSYRRSDYVLLAGEDDRQYFADRETFVVGMPVVERLARKRARFPELPLVALNVNFTYGVLEWRRDLYVRSALEGCRLANVDWAISQHPADSGSLEDLKVTELSQYELIDQCSVFVSRFATGIIEALASGKPAIYFNPHGEKARKFTEPMGAFRVARDADELCEAILATLEEVQSGKDFRGRAARFLQHHANYEPGTSALSNTASTIREILDRHPVPGHSISAMYLEAFHSRFPSSGQAGLVGEFSREQRAVIDEEELVALYLGRRPGLMLHIESQDELELEGLREEEVAPEVVLARFGSKEAMPSGDDVHNTARALLARNYTVYVSEWHPFTRHDSSRDWRRLVEYSEDLVISGAWGKLVGFRDAPPPGELAEYVLSALGFDYRLLVADSRPGRFSLPWIRAGLKHCLKPVILMVARVIKALANTERGNKLKRRVEDAYERHIGRSDH